MKKLLSILTITALLTSQLALAKGKIQDEDVKSEAELISAGSNKTHLPNAQKVYVTANGINDTLHNAITNGAIGGGGGASGVELLKDTGFEAAVSPEFTNTGGTFTHVSSGPNLLVGLGSATFQASATSQSIQSAAHTVPNGLFGRACSASMLYKGGDANLKFLVTDGTNVIQSQVLAASSTPMPVSLYFLCPSSGTIQWKILSSASSAVIAVDQAHLGENAAVSVSQASYAGGVTTSGCILDAIAVGGSFTDMAASGCVAGTALKGSATAFANTGNGAVTFANLPPGEYEAVWTGTCDATGMSSGTNYQFRLTDGTITGMAAKILAVHSTGNATEQSVPCTLHDHVTYSTAGSRSFKLQATGDGTASLHFYMDSANGGAPFSLFKYPSIVDVVSQTSGQAATWMGHLSTTVSGWSTSSTSINDLTASGTNIITQDTNRNFGSVVAYGTRPGVTFNAQASHEYDISFTSGAHENTPSECITLQLTDGTSVITSQNTCLSAGDIPVVLRGHWIAPSTGASNIWVQGAVSSGSSTGFYAAASNRVDISIQDITQPGPTLVLPGNVQSPSAGQMNMVSVSFAGNSSGSVACSSDPCTIVSQSGGVSAVNWPGGNGNYSVAFSAGTFSAPPVCTCTPNNTAAATTGCSLNNLATSSALPLFLTNASGTGTNDGAQVICVGPK